jgi:hypothetical protein
MGGKLVLRRPNESPAMFRARMADAKMASDRLRDASAWDHKREGTFQTHAHANRQRQGSIARLFQDGFISREELQDACEIAYAAELIERDVALKVARYDFRVDFLGSNTDLLAERIGRVRLEIAYTYWRKRIPQPRAAVLAMLTGETKSYTRVAAEYRMGKKRAKKLVLSALAMWEEAKSYADTFDRGDLAQQHAIILGMAE